MGRIGTVGAAGLGQPSHEPAAPKDPGRLISRENIWIDADAATAQLTSEAETETTNG